jgi:hypothetical protein
MEFKPTGLNFVPFFPSSVLLLFSDPRSLPTEILARAPLQHLQQMQQIGQERGFPCQGGSLCQFL